MLRPALQRLKLVSPGAENFSRKGEGEEIPIFSPFSSWFAAQPGRYRPLSVPPPAPGFEKSDLKKTKKKPPRASSELFPWLSLEKKTGIIIPGYSRKGKCNSFQGILFLIFWGFFLSEKNINWGGIKAVKIWIIV